MEEPIRGMFIILGILFSLLLIYNILCLIGNVVILSKTSRQKWFGLIPIVGDYELYMAFWSRNMFFVYLGTLLISNFLSVYVGNQMNEIYCIIEYMLNCILLILNVALMNKIRLAFGRGFGWLFFLVLLYPIAGIILGCKYSLRQTQEAQDEPPYTDIY